MATKKMEGRIETMEEHIAEVHGEMNAVKGELQRLGPLEVKVDSMLDILSLIDRMEKPRRCYKGGKIPKGLFHRRRRRIRTPAPKTLILGFWLL